MMKKKKKTDTYTLYKFTQEKSGCEAYRLVSETGRDTLTTHNLTFMLNFIMRLRDSGHAVIADESFCSGTDECSGCVLNTNTGCMMTLSVPEEVDENE